MFASPESGNLASSPLWWEPESGSGVNSTPAKVNVAP